MIIGNIYGTHVQHWRSRRNILENIWADWKTFDIFCTNVSFALSSFVMFQEISIELVPSDFIQGHNFLFLQSNLPTLPWEVSFHMDNLNQANNSWFSNGLEKKCFTLWLKIKQITSNFPIPMKRMVVKSITGYMLCFLTKRGNDI